MRKVMKGNGSNIFYFGAKIKPPATWGSNFDEVREQLEAYIVGMDPWKARFPIFNG